MPDGPLSKNTHDALRTLGIDSGGSRDDAAEPVDLRAIPREQWEQYESFPILLPPDVAKYLAGLDSPITVLDKDHMEESAMTFHGVTAPWCIVLSHGVARLMRA